jgi:hypothetical protein
MENGQAAPPNPATTALVVLASAVRGRVVDTLKLGRTPFEVMDILLNELARIAASAEPAAAREQIAKNVAKALPKLIEEHRDQQHRTPSGIILPSAMR